VQDVVATASWYRDRLGFAYDRFWGDPPCFCMVGRNGVVVMLSQVEGGGPIRPNRLADPAGEAWDAYVWVDDADELERDVRARGAAVVRGLCDQPYGCRDFEVEDCNGYRLCFGHDLEDRGARLRGADSGSRSAVRLGEDSRQP
jgi:predicted enzyme related to lactoylglutathione lyase